MSVWEDADVVFTPNRRRIHSRSPERGNGPYGCSVRAWVIRSIGQVILHQEKKSSEFQAMVMGSVTFFGVTSVI